MARYDREVPGISVYYTTNSNLSSGTIIPFDTTYGGAWSNIYRSGVDIDGNNGRLRVHQEGLYSVTYGFNLYQNSSGLISTFSIRKNFVNQWVGTDDVYLVNAQPTMIVVNLFLNFTSTGQFMDANLNGFSTASLRFNAGTYFTMYKVA